MTMEELVIAVRVTAEDAQASIDALREGFERVERAGGEGLAAVQKQATALTRALSNTSALKKQVSAYKDMAAQAKRTGSAWDGLSDEVKAFAKRLGVADGDIDGLISGLDGLETQLDGTMSGGAAQLRGIISELEGMRAQLLSIPQAEITADNTQALNAINVAIAAANALLALFGQAGIEAGSAGKRSGGGGGGSRRADTSAEDAARAAERAQEEAYRGEIERIEHRRHLGQITAQEEIAELERVKREYARTAEQIMDIDERIYDARKALREHEQEKITALHDSIVDALSARYEEQRRIEQQRISDSVAAWEKWSDDTCAAIEKQIAALDEQAEAEDREKTRAENLRKIAGLEEALRYETDAYNQNQLKKQIEQAKDAWAEIQTGWAREDERGALEAQMQAIRDQADAEIKKLEKESERVDGVYDELLKGQSLAAEAQKLLMESSQEELLGLLSSYAPDYEATGRTLGEKLYEGFRAAFGDVSWFFEQIDTQFEAMTDRAQQAVFGAARGVQASGQASASVSSPVIQQTVNFNQPIETPADVTRRMQQVSEGLAGMMA